MGTTGPFFSERKWEAEGDRENAGEEENTCEPLFALWLTDWWHVRERCASHEAKEPLCLKSPSFQQPWQRCVYVCVSSVHEPPSLPRTRPVQWNHGKLGTRWAWTSDMKPHFVCQHDSNSACRSHTVNYYEVPSWDSRQKAALSSARHNPAHYTTLHSAEATRFHCLIYQALHHWD